MTSVNSEFYCFIAMVRLEVILLPKLAVPEDLPPIKSAAFFELISCFELSCPEYILGGFDCLVSVTFEVGGKVF